MEYLFNRCTKIPFQFEGHLFLISPLRPNHFTASYKSYNGFFPLLKLTKNHCWIVHNIADDSSFSKLMEMVLQDILIRKVDYFYVSGIGVRRDEIIWFRLGWNRLCFYCLFIIPFQLRVTSFLFPHSYQTNSRPFSKAKTASLLSSNLQRIILFIGLNNIGRDLNVISV